MHVQILIMCLLPTLLSTARVNLESWLHAYERDGDPTSVVLVASSTEGTSMKISRMSDNGGYMHCSFFLCVKA
jgi:hypothetical protein